MKKCINCNAECPDIANFCYVCGAELPESEPVKPVVIENEYSELIHKSSPETASTYIVSEPIVAAKTTQEDRQDLLDTMRKKLKGEIITWRTVSIISIICVVLCWMGFLTSFAFLIVNADSSAEGDYYYEYDMEDEYYDEYEDEFTASYVMFMVFYIVSIYGVYAFIPTAVIGFIFSAKASKCKKLLYKDCSYAYRRCNSPSIIIIAAVFNPLVLIFTIPEFKLARNNRELFAETAEIQYRYFNSDSNETILY